MYENNEEQSDIIGKSCTLLKSRIRVIQRELLSAIMVIESLSP